MAQTKEQIIKDSIIIPYRELSGEQSIPKGKQYWTTDGKELQILLDERFITKSQFRTYSHKDDFVDIDDAIIGRRLFNPEIVYFGNTNIHSFVYVSSLLKTLEHNAKEVMVICDFIFGKTYVKMCGYGQHQYYREDVTTNDPNDIVQILHDNYLSFDESWEVFDHCYTYQKRNSKLKMGRLMLFPKGTLKNVSFGNTKMPKMIRKYEGVLEYMSYEEACKYVKETLGLRNMKEYREWASKQPIVEARRYRQESK